MDYRYETLDSARDFHRKRRAFIIYDNELLFLPHGSALSHYEYCTSIGIDRQTFNGLTRGYFLDNMVCFYQNDFGYNMDVIEEALPFLDEIAMHVGCDIFNVYFGALPSQNFKLDYHYGRYINGSVVLTAVS